VNQSIIDDLRVAVKGGMRNNVFGDPHIKEWMKTHGVTEQDIG
jgi:hypothetical protein